MPRYRVKMTYHATQHDVLIIEAPDLATAQHIANWAAGTPSATPVERAVVERKTGRASTYGEVESIEELTS